jgi:DNA-binding beta-propeller fold protein YncE
MRLVAAVLVAAAIAGCSDRERANPFDPKNPNTRGAPSNLVAMAGDGRVDLTWDAASGVGFVGFRLYRKTPLDTAYAPLSGVLAPATTTYQDVALLNGLEHRYRLLFVFDDGERGPAAEDVATPGRARPWLVDGSRGRLYRITPDGRRVAAEFGGFVAPAAVAVDSVRGHVWLSDALAGRVAAIDPATGVTVSIPGLVTPSSLAVDPLDRVTWVCDEDGSKLWAFDPAGNPVGAPIEPLELPLSVAVDVFDRSVVVCERAGSRLRRYAPDHSLLATLTVDRPSRVAVDSVTRRAWVTSFEAGTLTRVPPSFTAIELTIPGFEGPIGVAVDPKRGTIWVADAVAGEVVALDRTGAVLFRVGGLPEARELAADPETGDLWVVVPGSGELVRISATGQVLHRLGGFAQPLGIAVDPGRR